MTLNDLLDKVETELKKRETFWLESEDPYQINKAVAVALAEVRDAISKVRRDENEP